MSRRLSTIGVALVVLLAGCLGGLTGTPTSGPNPATDGPAGDDAAIEPSNGGGTSSDSGRLTFYVSDEPNAIGDFEHLNVTITKIGVHQVEAGEDATDSPTATATATSTATPDNDSNDTATASPTPTETADGEADDGEDGESEERDESDGDDAGNGDGQWVEYEVNETVDLTNLVGANSTKLGVLSAPAGEYDAVFIHVSEVDATLKNGESVNVKLPSNKLQIHKDFAVESGSEVSFVFDIAVHKAGKSGKYILKPVISQSGTGDEVDIDDVDDDEEDDTNGEGPPDDAGNGGGEEAEADLEATLRGDVQAGNEVTLSVTGPDGPVAGATVEVNGEEIGTTADDGTISFTVPDADALEITVESGDSELEVERDVSDAGGGGQGGDGQGNGQGNDDGQSDDDGQGDDASVVPLVG